MMATAVMLNIWTRMSVKGSAVGLCFHEGKGNSRHASSNQSERLPLYGYTC